MAKAQRKLSSSFPCSDRMAHSPLLTSFSNLAAPGLFICPEHDPMFPEEKRNAAWEVAKSTLGPKKVFTSFVYVAGLTHGYAIKGDDEDEFTAIGMQQ